MQAGYGRERDEDDRIARSESNLFFMILKFNFDCFRFVSENISPESLKITLTFVEM